MCNNKAILVHTIKVFSSDVWSEKLIADVVYINGSYGSMAELLLILERLREGVYYKILDASAAILQTLVIWIFL